MQLGQEKQLVLMLSTGGVVVQSDSPARGGSSNPSNPPWIRNCMYVCYLCMCADMYVCMYVCLYACMYVYMYVCMYVSKYVCMYGG